VTRRGAILFALLGIAWGIPYLLIKVAVEQLDPAMLVLARTAIAAAVLLPFAIARGEIMPVLRRWRPLLVFTVVELVVPQFLLGSAEERLRSSTTGLLIAGAVVLGEPVTGWSVLGFVLILAGCYLTAVRRPAGRSSEVPAGASDLDLVGPAA